MKVVCKLLGSLLLELMGYDKLTVDLSEYTLYPIVVECLDRGTDTYEATSKVVKSVEK